MGYDMGYEIWDRGYGIWDVIWDIKKNIVTGDLNLWPWHIEADTLTTELDGQRGKVHTNN